MKRVSREERARQVAECEASGLTVREWCVANGVPEATMHWWRRRLREDEGAALAPSFVEVAAVCVMSIVLERISHRDLSGFLT